MKPRRAQRARRAGLSKADTAAIDAEIERERELRKEIAAQPVQEGWPDSPPAAEPAPAAQTPRVLGRAEAAQFLRTQGVTAGPFKARRLRQKAVRLETTGSTARRPPRRSATVTRSVLAVARRAIGTRRRPAARRVVRVAAATGSPGRSSSGDDPADPAPPVGRLLLDRFTRATAWLPPAWRLVLFGLLPRRVQERAWAELGVRVAEQDAVRRMQETAVAAEMEHVSTLVADELDGLNGSQL